MNIEIEKAEGMPETTRGLLQTKLHPPHLPGKLMQRAHLFEQLNIGYGYKMNLLATPTGFGKTTLVNQWLSGTHTSRPQAPFTWITLDEADNDPLRFWHYVIAACQRWQSDIGEQALAELLISPQTPFTLPSLDTVITLLINDLTRLSERCILVLDNYHVITENTIHKTLEKFLEHLPGTVHVMLLTRRDPPFPLTRWRVRGDLYDLFTTNLRFSREEEDAFLGNEVGVHLSVQALLHLDTLLEGWPAGLRMVALALRQKRSEAEIETYVLNLHGGQRSFQEYFVEEIFSTRPAPIQDFLLRTSILPRLCAPLCNDLTGNSDSATLLENLEHEGLFLEVVDASEEHERWYRYPVLFAEAMQEEARQRMGEDTVRDLALQASQWFERQVMFQEAIDMSFKAQDRERVALLMENVINQQSKPSTVSGYTASDFHALCRQIEQLPDEVLARHPILSFSYANALIYAYILDEVTPTEEKFHQMMHCLQMAETRWRQTNNTARLGEVFAFRAIINRQLGAIDEAVQLAQQALANLPDEKSNWYMISQGVLGTSILLAGQLQEARQIFQHRPHPSNVAGRSFTRPGIILFGRVCREQEELRQAAASLGLILAEAREDNDHDDIADTQIELAAISYARNDLTNAEERAREALALAQQLNNEENIVHAHLWLAMVIYARGETAAALQYLLEHLAWLQPNEIPLRGWLCREVEARQAWLQMMLGDLVAAERWISKRAQYTEKLPGLQQEKEELLVARWLLINHQLPAVQERLTSLLEAAQEAGRTRNILEAQLIMAQVYAAHQQLSEGKRLLRKVIAHCCPENDQRIFLDEGTAIVPLLQAVIPDLRSERESRFVRSLMQQLSPQDNPGVSGLLVEPLSPQELRVLRLLVNGRTNPEIASELVVSINTVKTHIQNIYRKLNVENRVAASEAARQYRLLD